MVSDPRITILPAQSLCGEPWAASLHSTVIQAFKRKDIQAFPPSWTRLNPDPVTGISGLGSELGAHGYIAILLLDGEPLGCGGFLPFRGNDWINKETSGMDTPDNGVASGPVSEQPSAEPEEWEVCCFCIHPDNRKQGLSKKLLHAIEDAVRAHGGRRLAVNYSTEETGAFWPRLGFVPVPGATSILKKGFTHTVGMEGLRADLHFQIASKSL